MQAFFYSHRNFQKPQLQPPPHSSFEDEVSLTIKYSWLSRTNYLRTNSDTWRVETVIAWVWLPECDRFLSCSWFIISFYCDVVHYCNTTYMYRSGTWMGSSAVSVTLRICCIVELMLKAWGSWLHCNVKKTYLQWKLSCTLVLHKNQDYQVLANINLPRYLLSPTLNTKCTALCTMFLVSWVEKFVLVTEAGSPDYGVDCTVSQ